MPQPFAQVAMSGLMRKMASIHEIKTKLIPSIPRDMAIKVQGELVIGELNFGNPSTDLEPVAVDIGIRTGGLRRSFGFGLSMANAVEQLGPTTWAVMQVQAGAPYAADVAAYAQRRFGMTYLDSVRRRTHDYLMKGAKDEWEYAWKRIAEDRPYKYHPLYGVD